MTIVYTYGTADDAAEVVLFSSEDAAKQVVLNVINADRKDDELAPLELSDLEWRKVSRDPFDELTGTTYAAYHESASPARERGRRASSSRWPTDGYYHYRKVPVYDTVQEWAETEGVVL